MMVIKKYNINYTMFWRLKSFSLLTIFLLHCWVPPNSYKSVKKGQEVRINPAEFTLTKGIITFQKLTFADWEVDRKGLIDLKDPVAIKAGIQSGAEPIQIYMFVIDHPVHGRFIIDTGIADSFREEPTKWLIDSNVASIMNMEKLKIKLTTGKWLKENPVKIKGAFLTHLHLDHILGSSELSAETLIYTGPNEYSRKGFWDRFSRDLTDKLLGDAREIQELEFPQKDPEIGLSSLDFFGDKSLIIFHSPGHTPGSLAFLIMSVSGPQLVVGDTCHTIFGWKNNIPPGEFTTDLEENRKSLTLLKKLKEKIPNLKIHLGHQSLE